MSYTRFFAMILTSTIVMYGITYLTSFNVIEHAHFSEMRLYMALVMGSAMAIIMLSFMLNMYTYKWVNASIVVGSLAVFASALWLARSQVTIDDVSYMRAMIPHHSIAILTSERANIRDRRVRELADEIADTQRKEIREMESLIKSISEHGVVATDVDKDLLPVFKGSF